MESKKHSESECIRKIVGDTLTRYSPFQRLDALRRNAIPFCGVSKYEESDLIIIRKVVGQTSSQSS